MKTWLITVDADDAPLRLPPGAIVHSIAERKRASCRSDVEARRDITIATDLGEP